MLFLLVVVMHSAPRLDQPRTSAVQPRNSAVYESDHDGPNPSVCTLSRAVPPAFRRIRHSLNPAAPPPPPRRHRRPPRPGVDGRQLPARLFQRHYALLLASPPSPRVPRRPRLPPVSDDGVGGHRWACSDGKFAMAQKPQHSRRATTLQQRSQRATQGKNKDAKMVAARHRSHPQQQAPPSPPSPCPPTSVRQTTSAQGP